MPFQPFVYRQDKLQLESIKIVTQELSLLEIIEISLIKLWTSN